MVTENEGHRREKRSLTGEQIKLIRSYEIMGNSLSRDLSVMPELKEELSDLLQDAGLTYEGLVRYFFFESGRDIRSLVNSPFVRAFQETAVCADEERRFLADVRSVATIADIEPSPEEVDRFNKWVETRVKVMAKGLQRCVLDSGLFEPLTLAEQFAKSKEGLRIWREENPERFAEIVKSGSQASAEAAKPRVFTAELRAQIQAWFDKGYTSEIVCELLQAKGLVIDSDSLREAVLRYDDLHYTPGEIRKKKRQGYLKALAAIFEISGSRSKTIEILENLGYSRAVTDVAIAKLGLRERVNWKAAVDINGNTRTLKDILLEFSGRSYPKVIDEYKAFVVYLHQNGIKVDISEDAYRSTRNLTIKAKNEIEST